MSPGAESQGKSGARMRSATLGAAICAYATATPLSIMADTSANRTCGSAP